MQFESAKAFQEPNNKYVRPYAVLSFVRPNGMNYNYKYGWGIRLNGVKYTRGEFKHSKYTTCNGDYTIELANLRSKDLVNPDWFKVENAEEILAEIKDSVKKFYQKSLQLN